MSVSWWKRRTVPSLLGVYTDGSTVSLADTRIRTVKIEREQPSHNGKVAPFKSNQKNKYL